jgi:hypothetical protein
MSTAADIPADKPKPRLGITFTRLALGLAVLCLLVWCLKSIHYALQPKYQGKTAEEWFALVDPHAQLGSGLAISHGDPAIQAFQHLGPSAARFLWRELHVTDTALKKLFIRKAAEWSDGRWDIEPSETRNFKALVALGKMGPAADCLIPELLIHAQSPNRQDAYLGLSLIGHIGTRPEVAVPLFLSNVTSTNPMAFGQSMAGLEQYGPQASNALPALEQALTLRTGHDRLLVAYAMVGIGDRSKLTLLLAEVQNTNSPYRTNALSLLLRLKTDALDAVPALLAFAKSSTNDYDLQTHTARTIEQISPGTAKAAGLRP